ncbi:MAG: glycosyltransferase family 4 protein [Planctomycetales bacterium]|nr:glycosyltransferase family 4 protein [Planctomycetales bacterium]
MKLAYLTAGAAGMYCGSCLHDNALAKALIKTGHDAILVPVYTPIQTDEEDISRPVLFFGGLNVYLQQLTPIFRLLPKWMDRWLDTPALVRWIASRAMGTSASNLGALTVSMLRGKNGNQRKEVDRLCEWLETLSPDVIIFSNLLIAGCLTQIKERIRCPVIVILQGDDIFYANLEEPFRTQALTELRRLAAQVDRFVVHSQSYGKRMQQLLEFPSDRMSVLNLSIDTHEYRSLAITTDRPMRPPTIGYLARLAPEKGLHSLVEAFIKLRQQGAIPDAKLEIAGWLGAQHQAYWRALEQRMINAGLQNAFRYWGTIDRGQKLAFLQSIDVLCVPTSYQEPKGLFVLEALACGVPYVLPEHGAFPELHSRLQAGHLFDPESGEQLVKRLVLALQDLPASRRLGQDGRQRVFDTASTQHEAEQLLQIISSLIPHPST